MRRAAILGACLAASAALPLPASAGGPAPASPETVCAFRLRGLQVLFSAANGVALAREALGASDAAGAGSALAAAAQALRMEAKRVRKEGKPLLETRERKTLARALRKAGKPALRAARKARRRPEKAETSAEAAAGAVGALLAEQSGAFAGGCSGGELRVTSLRVAPGERRVVPGGAVVTAEEGVTVLGDLVMEGAPGDGLEIVALAGDVVLDGTVDATGAADPDAAARETVRVALPSSRRTREPLSHPAETRGGAPASCGEGGDVRIAALTGDLWIGARHYAIAGPGADCPPRVVTELAQLDPEDSGYDFPVYRGRAGGKGGNVILEAPSGVARFAPRAPGDPGPFEPGSGGAGEDVEVSPAFDLASLPPFRDVALGGGPGGSSGLLNLLPTGGAPEGLDRLPRIFRGGTGGDGGDLVSDQRSGSSFLADAVVTLWLEGGDGGAGVFAGGRGGDVRYQGDRVVRGHVAGFDGPPGVVAVGGDGGSSRQRVSGFSDESEFVGGDGGDAEAVGHRGADGDAQHPDGGGGGAVVASGGSGGRDLGGGPCPACAGGHGGAAAGTGGAGGDGRPSCGVTLDRGGRGGRGGPVIARGGDGASVPGGTGGDGGEALRAIAGAPGRGGNGAPPGSCGLEAEWSIAAGGAGGDGRILGAEGDAVLAGFHECAEGVATECGDLDGSCEPPRSWTSIIVRTYPRGGAPEVTTQQIHAQQNCTDGSCIPWHVVVHQRVESYRHDGTSTISEHTSEGDVQSAGGGDHVKNFVYHCSPTGELHTPNDPATDTFPNGDGSVAWTLFHACDSCFCPDANYQPPTICCQVSPTHWVALRAAACP